MSFVSPGDYMDNLRKLLQATTIVQGIPLHDMERHADAVQTLGAAICPETNSMRTKQNLARDIALIEAAKPLQAWGVMAREGLERDRKNKDPEASPPPGPTS